MKPHRGALILVFGILGLILCPPFGAVAIGLGWVDLRRMNAGLMDPTGRGLTWAGIIVGIVGLVVSLALFLAWLVMVALSLAAAGAAAGAAH